VIQAAADLTYPSLAGFSWTHSLVLVHSKVWLPVSGQKRRSRPGCRSPPGSCCSRSCPAWQATAGKCHAGGLGGQPRAETHGRGQGEDERCPTPPGSKTAESRPSLGSLRGRAAAAARSHRGGQPDGPDVASGLQQAQRPGIERGADHAMAGLMLTCGASRRALRFDEGSNG